MTDKAKAAIATLENLGYNHEGGILWKPPLGKAPDFNLLDTLHARIASLEAQLSARQAAPDEALRDALVRARDWFESQAKVVSKGCGSPWNLMQLRAERDAADAALTAAPPPPEREQLTDEQIARAAVNAGMKPIYDKPKKPMVNALGSSVPFTWLKAFAHGIGATNDNP